MNPLEQAATPQPEATDPAEDFASLLRADDRARATAVDRSGGSKQIDATVVAIANDVVYLDIGYKTEGKLPLTSFAADARPAEAGDRVRVTVRGRDDDGYYTLARQRAQVIQDFSSQEEAFEAKGSVLGTVTGVVKGGLTVDIGMRAFLPASRSGTRDTAELEQLVGQQVRVLITQLDLEGGESGRPDAIVDRRAVLEQEARAASDERFAQLAEGQIVSATVRSLTEFGAFVDLGGTDALLHISDLSWQRVANPADLIAAGDRLDVQVLRIDSSDPARRRISVGLKQLQPHPWDTVAERFQVGQKVTGIVTREADFGAFVELAPGIEGLIHISEMAWGKKVKKPSDIVKVGDQAEVVILAIDTAQKRMALGLRQALGDPWIELMKTVSAGSTVEGPVSQITKFGAFVTVTEGVEGLVHISEITAEKRLNHPSDALHVGQQVRAQVLEIDRDKRQLRLSIKQLVPGGLDDFLAEHKPGDTVSGRVLEVDRAAATARVELGEGIVLTCAIPAAEDAAPAATVDLAQLGSLLSAKWKTATKDAPPAQATRSTGEVKVGQVRSFRLTAVDADSKSLAAELL